MGFERRPTRTKSSANGNLLAAIRHPLTNLANRFIGKDPGIVAAMLTIVAGTLGFIKFTSEVSEGDTESFDRFVMEALGRHRGPDWLPDLARDLTALGAGSVLGCAILAVVGFLVLRKQNHAALLVTIASVSGYFLSAILKETIGRERPTIFEHGDIVSSLSFPSGHAMMSAVVYLTLGSLLMNLVKERRLKIYVITVASLMTFTIGISRVYLGVHWPTDVLAGWTAGLVWALACSVIAKQLQRRGVVETSAKTL